MNSRYTDLLGLLIRYPLAAEQVFHASKNFETPFRSESRVRQLLKALYDEGFLGREPIPHTGAGQCRYLYYLRPKAKHLLPEVADCSPSVFRGFSESIPHNLALFECMAHIERAIGEAGKKHVKLLAAIRPRHFEVDCEALFQEPGRRTKLIPDYTLLLTLRSEKGWVPSLFFFELQRQTAVINPTAPASLARSFRGKLLKYKRLSDKQVLRAHPVIRHLEQTFGCIIPGFRVMTIVAKKKGGQAHLQSLVDCAAAMNIREMVWFTTMEQVTEKDALRQKIWTLPTRAQRSLIDPSLQV